LVGKDGRFRVVDFGLARAPADDATVTFAATRPRSDIITVTIREAAAQHRPSLARVDTVTETGAVLGTPAYMAPEQHMGTSFDARCDQYSFCVALFESLTGRRPFVASDCDAFLTAKLAGPIVAGRGDRRLPAKVLEVLARGMSARPEARFRSMNAALTALASAVDDRRHGRFVNRGTVAAMLLGWVMIATGASADGEVRAHRYEVDGVVSPSAVAKQTSPAVEASTPVADTHALVTRATKPSPLASSLRSNKGDEPQGRHRPKAEERRAKKRAKKSQPDPDGYFPF
jgi:serine/threonine protein kinase